jgi:hypothetical protein
MQIQRHVPKLVSALYGEPSLYFECIAARQACQNTVLSKCGTRSRARGMTALPRRGRPIGLDRADEVPHLREHLSEMDRRHMADLMVQGDYRAVGRLAEKMQASVEHVLGPI